MEDVIRERARHYTNGHTPESDARSPLRNLLRLPAESLSAALDYAHFGRPALTRRYLVRAAALCLAAIDRIDMEGPKE